LSDPNTSKLSSIKTYLLVALIFNVVFILVWGLVSIFLFFLVIPILLLIVSIVVLSRTLQMRGAAESGDIAKLKALNSLGWAIVALLFSGLINGIMLLLAHGTIEGLQSPGGVSPGMATMSPAAQGTPTMTRSAQGGTKYCPNCGTAMAADVAFCPKCGAKQP
jgi:hypothetical protein